MPNQRRPDQYKKYVEHIAVQFYRSLYLREVFKEKKKTILFTVRAKTEYRRSGLMLTDESCMIEGRVAENAIQIENRRIIL